jgi:hypothetical protein
MSEMAPLDASLDLSIPGFGQAGRGNKQGFVEHSSDENAAWHRDRWRR